MVVTTNANAKEVEDQLLQLSIEKLNPRVEVIDTVEDLTDECRQKYILDIDVQTINLNTMGILASKHPYIMRMGLRNSCFNFDAEFLHLQYLQITVNKDRVLHSSTNFLHLVRLPFLQNLIVNIEDPLY